jgi:hypothetical protein
VILGAPGYARAAAFDANGIEELSDPIETPIDPSPPPPSEPLPPNPTPIDALPPNPDPVDITPMPTPSPEETTEPATPPIVVIPKPGGSGTPTPTPETQEPAPTPTTNAPAIGGEAVTPPPVEAKPANPAAPSTSRPLAVTRREPYITPGLHTQAEQSPHYATARAYGLEHGYSDDEIMKLAVLMQNNRGNSNGREWLDLKPEVLRAAVGAVVRNPDNSFDTSGVFGGRRGYYDSALATQRININAEGFALDGEFAVVGSAPLTPPAGWVLDQEATGGGDAGSQTQQFYRPSDEMLAANDIPYLPMMLSGYVQVMHGNDSELSVGADGGYHDLSLIDFHPDYGLVTTPDNYRPINNDDGLDQLVLGAILTVASYGVLYGAGAIVGTAPAAGAGVLSAAQALAISTALGTTISTGDLRQGFIAGLASFAGSYVAQWVVGPSGLALNINPSNPWTVGNFVSSIITGTVSGAIQGDWRRGLINGLVSFAGNVIANELSIPRSVASAAIRALYDPTGALHGFISDLIVDTGMAGIDAGERATRRQNAIDELMRTGFTPDQAAQLVNRLIAEGIRLDTVTAGARGEVQQQVTWIRDAIDQGNFDTARSGIDNLLRQSNATTPAATVYLLQALGLESAATTLVADAYRRGDPSLDADQARTLATLYLATRGFTRADMILPAIVVRPQLPFTSGSEFADRILGGVIGGVTTGYSVVRGWFDFAVSVGRIPFDGWLQIANVAIDENVFADSSERNQARIELAENIFNNLDKLPGEVIAHFERRWARANELEAQGDHIGAAREITETVGEIITTFANPRSPSVMRILERLGMNPATAQRVVEQLENGLSRSQQARRAFNYTETFFAANPSLRGQVVVHHAIELQALDKYPGLFTAAELNALGMLRGVPNELNNQFHNSALRIEWNQFYKDYPPGSATRDQILQFSRDLDARYGQFFVPPVKPSPGK